LKFQAVAEKTAKDARGLLYFAVPGSTADIIVQPVGFIIQCQNHSFVVNGN